MDGFIKFLLLVLTLTLVSVVGTVIFLTTFSSVTAPTKLTHKERISMCNARGGIMSDGVCQRVYVNLCHRRL